jgi:hypothetical protein
LLHDGGLYRSLENVEQAFKPATSAFVPTFSSAVCGAASHEALYTAHKGRMDELIGATNPEPRRYGADDARSSPYFAKLTTLSSRRTASGILSYERHSGK